MRRQLLIFLAFITLLAGYTNFKIQESLQIHFFVSLLITLPLFVVMFAGLFISRAKPLAAENTLYRGFVWMGSFLMGVWGTYILFSLILDMTNFFVFTLANFIPALEKYNVELVSFFEKAATGKLYLAIAFSVVGLIEVLRGPVIKKVQVKASINNLTIAQISDLHIGISVRTKYVKKVIDRTNALNPDIIVMTGDIIDASVQTIQPQIEMLNQLKAKHGVYFITGNHEYYSGIEEIIASLRKLDINILLNENKTIEINGNKILVAGITDTAAIGMHKPHWPDIQKAAQTRLPADYKILLAHQPNIYPKGSEHNFDLLLSGHTHGGQFFPFSLVVPLAHKYYRGLRRHKDMHIYVNPGTGYWGPMNRFGIPAEITLLNLQK